MGARVPHRLGLAALVPLAPGASPRGDGVDNWPLVKASPCQWKCASRSSGARVVREPTMKPTLASFRVFRLAVDSMPAPGDYDQGLDLGGLAELFNDTDDRGGLGPVALPATGSQGEAGPVDQ